jgi:hypothetical protein
MILNWIYSILLTTNHFFNLHKIKNMNDPRINVIFNKNFDGDYDNVMNRIVDHNNYLSCEGSGASVSATGDDDDGNDNNNNDDDSNDDDDDSDDDGDFFLRRQFDMKKLIICTTRAINMYYINYIYKELCMVSYNTGMCLLNEVLRGN